MTSPRTPPHQQEDESMNYWHSLELSNIGWALARRKNLMGIVCEPSIYCDKGTVTAVRRQGLVTGQRSKSNVSDVAALNFGEVGISCLTREGEAALFNDSCTTIAASFGSNGAGRSSSWTWHSTSPVMSENCSERLSSSSRIERQQLGKEVAVASQQDRVNPSAEAGNWHELLEHDLSPASSRDPASVALVSEYPEFQQHKMTLSSWDTRTKFLSPDYNCFIQGEATSSASTRASQQQQQLLLDDEFLLRHDNLNLNSQALLDHQEQQFHVSSVLYPPGGMYHSSSNGSVSAATSHPKSNLELLLGSSRSDKQNNSWFSWNMRESDASADEDLPRSGIDEHNFASKLNLVESGGLLSADWLGQNASKSGKRAEELSKRPCPESNTDAKRLKGSYSSQKTRFGTSSKKISSQRKEPALNTNLKPRAKQGCANDPQSIAARQRRERISGRLKILQELIPNGSKVDLVTMLEKAINYVKFLQLQVKVLMNDEYWPKREEEVEQTAP